MIERNHIEAATAILNQIAFSGGEDVDPSVTLAAWRASEGFAVGLVEGCARESALDSMAEISEAIESNGDTMTAEQLVAFLEREWLTAFQVGWVVRARAEKRATAKATST